MRLSEASKGFGGFGLAGWIETAWCCGQDTSLVLEGRNIREARSMPQSSIKKAPTIWFSCRPVRRKNQDGAYREAPRTAVRRVTQGGASPLRSALG